MAVLEVEVPEERISWEAAEEVLAAAAVAQQMGMRGPAGKAALAVALAGALLVEAVAGLAGAFSSVAAA
jgi:hypothetical protein